MNKPHVNIVDSTIALVRKDWPAALLNYREALLLQQELATAIEQVRPDKPMRDTLEGIENA